MKQALITKIETTYTPDGQGGYTEETIEKGSYDVKLSVSKDVNEATAYGVKCEQILKVIADEPLKDDEASLWLIIGPEGPQGEPGFIKFEDLTSEQKEELRGPQGPQGETGPQGPQGIQGPAGQDGVGIPAGGTTGQVLAKASNTDYDTEWVDQTGGGGSGEPGEDGGYYQPSVDDEGNLSWTASKEGMPAVDSSNIMGPQGPQGLQGPTGQTGPQGPEGSQGPAGYTPVRGTDYWTEEDQAAIVADVLAALPEAEEVSV